MANFDLLRRNVDSLRRPLGQQLSPTTNPYRMSMIRNNLIRGTAEVNPRNFSRCLAASEDLILRLESRFINSGLPNRVRALSFNKGGDILLSGHYGGSIKLWALDHIPPKLESQFYDGDLATISQVDFKTDSQDRVIIVLSDGALKTVHIREDGGATVIERTRYLGAYTAFVTLPRDRDLLYTCAYHEIWLVDMRESRQTLLKETPRIFQNKLAVNPAHEYLLAVGADDNVVRVFDIRKAGSPFHLCHPDSLDKNVIIEDLRFSVQGELLVSYFGGDLFLFSKDMNHSYPTSRIQKYASDNIRYRERYREAYAGFYGPNCDYVFRGSDTSQLYFWRKKDGEHIHTLDSGLTEESMRFFICHPHLPMLAGSGDISDIQICTPQSW